MTATRTMGMMVQNRAAATSQISRIVVITQGVEASAMALLGAMVILLIAIPTAALAFRTFRKKASGQDSSIRIIVKGAVDPCGWVWAVGLHCFFIAIMSDVRGGSPLGTLDLIDSFPSINHSIS